MLFPKSARSSWRPSALAVVLTLAAPVARAQSLSAPPLELMGLAPGVPQSALRERVATLGGRLECKNSTVDPRFAECKTFLPRSPDGRTWSLLASVVGGSAAILLFTAPFTSAELGAFREELAAALGRPNLRKRGLQESFEWVRAGRMMRLTSRREAGRLQVAVSLVEGDVLDRLGPTNE